MTNHFNHSPTVGSLDFKQSNEEQQERIRQLEQRLVAAEAQLAVPKAKKKPGKFKWFKRIGRFFNKHIRPAIDTISRFLSSIASVKRAFA